MYVVVRKYRPAEGVDLEKIKDDIRKRVKEDFLPQVERLSGFVHYTLAFLEDGTVLSVSLFNTEASVGESVRFASMWIKQHLPSMFQEDPELFFGEIAVQHGELTSDDLGKETNTKPPKTPNAPAA